MWQGFICVRQGPVTEVCEHGSSIGAAFMHCATRQLLKKSVKMCDCPQTLAIYSPNFRVEIVVPLVMYCTVWPVLAYTNTTVQWKNSTAASPGIVEQQQR